MYTHFRIVKNVLVGLALLLGTTNILGQQAIVNTTLTPPYNVPLDQLKSQVMVMVTNTSVTNPLQSNFLRMRIEGDNGIVIQSISTNDYINPLFDINETESLTLNGVSGDLDELFDINNLTFSSITANEAYSVGLPTGSYMFCFQVFDSDFAPNSPESPAGCAMFNILGITNVNVTTQVMPPYSSDFFNYSNATTVMLQSAGSGDVSLFLDFKGDNGVHLQTNQGYLPHNIVLSGTPLTVGSFDLEPYFDFQNLISSGIPLAQLQQNGLPPGQYQICIRVRNEDGEFVSGEEPLGCSNFFTINAVEPPQLINPICGDSLTTGVNNIVFSWTTPPGASPATVEYTMKIIELLPGQDPNQAFLASTVPSFFEKSVFTQTSILYGPTDPPLENGKSYAWQVIAKDDELNTQFVNEGRSEVCWFAWKPNDPSIIPITTTVVQQKKPSLTQTFMIDPQPLPISSLKGKLLYKFKATTIGLLNLNNNNNTNPNNNGVFVDPNPVLSTIGSKPQVPKVGFPVSTANAKPLGGVSVSLVVTYLFNGEDNNGKSSFAPATGMQVGYMGKDKQASHEQILATTITDAAGNFNFNNFINPHEDYGLAQADIDAKQNSDVQNLWLKGDMYKVLRLKVNNQYYLSPDINITINPWESKDIGEVVSLVKSYNLKVLTTWAKGAFDSEQGYQGILSGVKLIVARTHIPNHVPDDEGSRENVRSASVYTVVGTGESTPDGLIFRNLVQHNPSNSKDRYRIMTSESETANVTYKNASKSYKANTNTSKFPYNRTTFGPTKGNYIGTALGSNITWNHELKIEDYSQIINLIPNKPRIRGRVQTTDVNSKKLSDTWVILLNEKNDPNSTIAILQSTKTDYQGRYRFDNLEMEFDEYNPNSQLTIVKGPKRTLFTSLKGFEKEKKNVGILKWGKQFVSPDADFNLEPDGYIHGYVVDDEGKSIRAKVNIENLTVQETKFGYINIENTNENKNNNNATGYYYEAVTGSWVETFAFKAPSGERQITVKAVGGSAENYGVYTSKINIPKTKATNAEPLKIVLNRKIKRIRFQVVEYKKSRTNATNQIPIAGARVTLEDIASFEIPRLTDNNGYVTFEFENQETEFTFSIEPPKGKEDEYSSETIVVTNVHNTTEIRTIGKVAYLKKAAKITGVVTVEGQPLEHAIVTFDEGDGTPIEAQTDDKGNYILKGIAQDKGEIVLWASKSGVVPNIIDDSHNIVVKAENEVNFDLKYDKEVSITSIFGFDVDIKIKEKQSDGSYIIKEGNLINIPSNQNFKLRKENVVLPFTNLKIKKTGANDGHGTPIFEPATNAVTLNDKVLELKLNNAFNAVLGDGSKPLTVINNNNKGQIKGKVGIEKNSFNTSNIKLEDKIPIYLTAEEGSTVMEVTAIGIDNPSKEKFGIVNPKGKELTFKLGHFDAEAIQDKSKVSDGQITLYTYLKTKTIAGMTPDKLEIEAGNLVLEPTKIIPIKNDNPLKFKLEKWDFETQKWIFNTTTLRIEMPDGIIKTGTIEVPAKDITISHEAFDIGNFELNELSLGGIAKLNIIGNNPSFGLNKNVGADNQAHWELRITGAENNPAANVKLPGFETGKTIDFDVISLLSNGEQQTGIANNEYMRFYNIIDVQPTSISSGDGYIDVSSMTNLGIPRIPESGGFIRFKNENGNVIAQVAPVPFTIDAPGKVKLSVGNKPENTEVKKGFFKAIGTLTDNEGIKLKASVQKTIAKTNIVIEPDQKMQLGGPNTSFKDIKGGINIDKTTSDWKKLVFSGELDGFKGIKKGKRQTFTVHGAITANDESVGVDNISTPFVNLALTYDIKNARFLGDLNVNQNLGAVKFVGSANMMVGAEGWYFSAGGKATPPGMGEMGMGMIIGNSSYMPAEVTKTLMQYAYDKNVPPTIKNGVSGMFITGRKDVPIINIPDWSIDLGVVSAKMGAKAGLDARIWMDFDSSGSVYGIGAMAFAHVYFNASSITCTRFGAQARAELGAKGAYQTANGNFNLDGCGSISVGGHFEQCVPTFIDGCKWCVGTSINKGVRLDLHLDSGGNTDISFGLDTNCSKQPLTSGW